MRRPTEYFTCAALLLAAAWPTAHAEAPRHRLLLADSSVGRIAIIDEAGQTEWEMKIGPLHDLHRLENGHILLQTNWTRIVEVEPQTDTVIWEYDSAVSNSDGRKVEVHSFQRLPNGNTLIAESGRSRLIEVNTRGEIVHELKLQVSDPHPHRDTRLVRQLTNGNYLVCHESDGSVREYMPDGRVVWDYPVPLFDRQPVRGHGPDAFGNQCFSALRLENGNTLISTGNGHSVIEVTNDKRIVWQVEQNELPGIKLAWVTTLQVLPNGNLVIGNCHAEEKNPQVIEITRDKRVVWTFHDFQRFGNALTNTQILSTNGQPINSELGSQR
jgi:hypothetical protein